MVGLGVFVADEVAQGLGIDIFNIGKGDGGADVLEQAFGPVAVDGLAQGVFEEVVALYPDIGWQIHGFDEFPQNVLHLAGGDVLDFAHGLAQVFDFYVFQFLENLGGEFLTQG